MENNDKAKKLLFGTTELPDNPEAKMNEEALKRKIEFTPITDASYDAGKLSRFTMDEHPQWSDPEMTGGIDDKKWEAVKAKMRDAQQGDKVFDDSFNAAVDRNREILSIIKAYCKENNITPEDLIEQHEYLCKMNHTILKEAIKNEAKK